MKSFGEFLYEGKFKSSTKLKPYERLLYKTYMEFLQKEFNTNIDISVSFRKMNVKNTKFGYIDIVGIANKKYKIVVENNIFRVLNSLAHEFTHIVQVMDKRLNYGFDKDKIKYVTWKNKNFISVDEYSKFTSDDWNIYKNLPWEKEAIANQKSYPKLFKKSELYAKLKGKDKNLDYFMDNDVV